TTTSFGAAAVRSRKSGATPARAATTIALDGYARRTAASAGSAITASPSQFGARTISRSMSATSLLFVAGRGEHALFRRGLDVAPAAMHPEPQAGIAAHVHFEHVGAALREVAQRVAVAGRRRIDGVLVDHAESSTRQRQREDRKDRRARAERDRRQRRRRR